MFLPYPPSSPVSLVLCLMSVSVTGDPVETVLFLESFVEAVTIFCFLYAVTHGTFEMQRCWDYVN